MKPVADVRWKTFRGVGVSFGEQVVRVKNDLKLKEYLRADSGRGFFRGMRNEYRPARRMARFLKDAYRRKYGEELEITAGSLETEIVWHYRVTEVCRYLRETLPYRLLPPFRRFVEWLWIHMEVIDCGKKEIDGNRFAWDLLDRWGL